MKTLKISAEKALELYPTSSSEMKAIFNDTFGEDYFKPKSLFETIKSYSDVCKALGEERITDDLFDPEIFDQTEINNLVSFGQLKQIEKLFNGDWKKDWSNDLQKKWYPWFRKNAVGWGFYGSFCGCVGSFDSVFYYKDKQTSDFIGNQEWIRNIYSKLI